MERIECDRMFVAVMESGSFSRAAQQQGVSVAKASKLVTSLEQQLGVRLLTRSTRALSPTDVGQLYYQRIQAILQQLDELDSTIQQSTGSTSGRLRMTAPLSFGIGQLTPALEAFALAYPDIQLEVDFSDRLVNLVEEGFDAAIRIGVPSDSNLIARRLCPARIVTVASPEYLNRHLIPEEPNDLKQHVCIVDTNFSEPNTWRFVNGDTEFSIHVKGKMRLSNADACLSAAKAGIGITHVPAFVASEALANGSVVRLLQAYEISTHGIYIMYPSNRFLPSRIRHLIDFLVAFFPEAPAWEQY